MRIWCTTVDGRRRRTAYSDPRRALVITSAYKPINRAIDRYGITHRRTGLLVCSDALFADLGTARMALRALSCLAWDYAEAQDPVNDRKAAATLKRIIRILKTVT